MKAILLAVFCALPLAAAHAEGDGQKITEVTVLSAESTIDLFDRVRDAHSRALQKGLVALNSSLRVESPKH